VSFKIPGRVEERAVSEGETVKAGQLVARLDRNELMQEVALRRAEAGVAQAALAELLAGSRPEEIRESEAGVHRAQAWLDEQVAGSRLQDIAAHKATVERAKAEVDRLDAEYTRQSTYTRTMSSRPVSTRPLGLHSKLRRRSSAETKREQTWSSRDRERNRSSKPTPA